MRLGRGVSLLKDLRLICSLLSLDGMQPSSIADKIERW